MASSGLPTKIVTGVLNSLDKEQRLALYNWSKSALSVVKNVGLDQKEKIKQIKILVHEEKDKRLSFFHKTFSKQNLKKFQNIAWTNRSWGARLAMTAAGICVAGSGFAMAGIAAFGGAIGVQHAVFKKTQLDKEAALNPFKRSPKSVK